MAAELWMGQQCMAMVEPVHTLGWTNANVKKYSLDILNRFSEYLGLSPQAKTEDISEYFADLCWDGVELGYTQRCIILDNNPTHQGKMQFQLAVHLEQMGFTQFPLGTTLTQIRQQSMMEWH